MIKMLVMDVDGTLTDGKIYMGKSGEIMKAFSCHDAVGVRKLKEYNIIPIILTGRESEIVVNRALEMNIDGNCIYQNIANKKLKLQEIIQKYEFNFDDIAYIGDDENDLECIKVCGFSACPNDAVDVIKKECKFISNFKAGDGAVRDFIEFIIKNNS